MGAGIGAVSGHLKNGMSNSDLKELGTVLDKGQAGLIVLYATNMADQIAASIKAERIGTSPTRSTPTRTSSPSSSGRRRQLRRHRPRTRERTCQGGQRALAGPTYLARP